jgi:hypothetical protein
MNVRAMFDRSRGRQSIRRNHAIIDGAIQHRDVHVRGAAGHGPKSIQTRQANDPFLFNDGRRHDIGSDQN